MLHVGLHVQLQQTKPRQPAVAPKKGIISLRSLAGREGAVPAPALATLLQEQPELHELLLALEALLSRTDTLELRQWQNQTGEVSHTSPWWACLVPMAKERQSSLAVLIYTARSVVVPSSLVPAWQLWAQGLLCHGCVGLHGQHHHDLSCNATYTEQCTSL